MKKTVNFNDAKNEFLQVNNLDAKSFEAKYYEYALKFDNNFLCFEKPSIKTRFCFGYGQNGISTQRDFEGALKQERRINEEEEVFINANLKDLNRDIEDIQTLIDVFFDNKPACYGCAYNKIFICQNSCDHLAYLLWSFNNESMNASTKVIREATKEDLLLILEVYKQQKENFKKRLNTYLKRYGLSKLTTWTYLVD